MLAGIDAVRRAGFPDLKLDTVVTRGDNDDELVDLVEFARDAGAEVRFIEYMDVGGATAWRPEAVVSRREMLARLTEHYGPLEPIDERSSAPAARFRLPDGLTVGIISSTTQPFCRTCDRARLTADGVLLLCLYAQHGTDLRRPLRAGASRETLLNLIRAVWAGRADRGAEERRAVRGRGAYIPAQRPPQRRAPGNAHAGGMRRRAKIFQHEAHEASRRKRRTYEELLGPNACGQRQAKLLSEVSRLRRLIVSFV